MSQDPTSTAIESHQSYLSQAITGTTFRTICSTVNYSSTKETDPMPRSKDEAASDAVGGDSANSAERTPPFRQQQQHAYHSPPQHQVQSMSEWMIVVPAIVPSSSTESAKTSPSPPKVSFKVANTIKRLGKKLRMKKSKAFKPRKPATKSSKQRAQKNQH